MEAREELASIDSTKRAEVACWSRERLTHGRPAPSIVSSAYAKRPDEAGTFSVSEILRSYAPVNVAERLDRILANIAARSGEPGANVSLAPEDVYLLFSSSLDQADYYLEALAGRGWLQKMAGNTRRLTPEGWGRVAESESPSASSDQAFVAMAFVDELEEAWRTGFLEGIQDAGYRALRVDKEEHNEKICDVIIAGIRQSRFLVADVTRHRQGVYFEAGFAMGLGLPVVWTCQRGDIEQAHFDTRQYNHIVWEEPADLRIALEKRIRATIA